MTGTLVTIVTNVATMVTTVVTIFVLDWRLALVSLAIIPLMIFPLSPVGRRMYDIRKKTREKRDEIESITQETLSISGITLIKSFVREPFERARFYRVGTDLMRLEIGLAMVGRWFIASINAMVVIGPALVWLAGGVARDPRRRHGRHDRRVRRAISGASTGRPRRWPACRCRSSARWPSSNASSTIST